MDEQNDIEVIPNGHITQSAAIDVQTSKERRMENILSDSDGVASKSRIAFLDIMQDNNKLGMASSPDRSPTVNAKPFVPPLDFTTLHENVGGIGKFDILRCCLVIICDSP